jgi:hypothetical protein
MHKKVVFGLGRFPLIFHVLVAAALRKNNGLRVWGFGFRV